ncbi:FixH family protein [Campylobacter sp. RM12640]|uniref:FixH family protein n=1 Tax=unclassified Campylobacter TaxID=2593542 RepID=UPI003015875E|nr:FixH family protein [Campylobacter sp. RM12640]MBZ7989654.1 FixH family protein [Campylobacter sp. RM12635]
MIKEGRHWPYLIVGSIIFMMIACIYTVYLSFDYPVDEDESYFLKYQDVENNYAKIKENEKLFLDNFAFRVLGDKTRLDVTKRPAVFVDNEVILKVKEKSNLKASNISVKAKLTRPHTKYEDKEIIVNYDDNLKEFKADLGDISNGRWTLLIDFKINELSKFYKLELCKNQCKKA